MSLVETQLEGSVAVFSGLGVKPALCRLCNSWVESVFCLVASRTVTRTFESPRSYHPSHSLLGRVLRWWTGDRLRGEAFFIVVLTGLTLVLLMAHYLGWALLGPLFEANPMWATYFRLAQWVSVFLLGSIGLIGFRPAVQVTCHPERIHLSQGDQTRTLAHEAIEAIDTISARQYHRHYRRYATTDIFISHLPDQVLLVRTPQGPVVLALSDPEAQASLLDLLNACHRGEDEPITPSTH